MIPASSDGDHDRTVIGRSGLQGTWQPGDKILNDTYVIEALLGKGGMGEVYKAEHIELKIKRAIKIILPQLANDPQHVQLFIEEARKLSLVDNDAIIRYYEFSRDTAGARYLVMEFVDGNSLARILERQRLEPNDVLSLLVRLAQGLAAAYERGIKAHRDISPANILMPQDRVERAKVIDFGIAKAADPQGVTLIGSDFAGKYSYVSPEQVGLYGGPDRVDQRSDIYSLALVLAAAALGFGRRLDMGNEPASVTLARQAVPDLGEIPAELQPVLRRMLEPRPEDRPASMRALIEEVRGRLPTAAAAARSAAPATAPAPRRAAGPRGRLPWGIGGGLAAAAALGAAAFFLLRPAPTLEAVQQEVAAAAGGYRCSDLSYSVAPDRSVAVSGFVATADERDRLFRSIAAIRGVAHPRLDIGLRPWPYCAVAAMLKPLAGAPAAAGTVLALAGPDATARVGTPLALDIRAPDFDGYAYVDYFSAQGDVLHLFPNAEDSLNFRPARNEFVLGRPPQVGMRRCWTLGGATGPQLVTYIASPTPLFAVPRPEHEGARDYLAALTRALAATPPGQRSATLLFFDLRPHDPAMPAAATCPN